MRTQALKLEQAQECSSALIRTSRVVVSLLALELELECKPTHRVQKLDVLSVMTAIAAFSALQLFVYIVSNSSSSSLIL